MIFKDRAEAGRKLSQLLEKSPGIKRFRRNLVVVSLLRGGFIVGNVVAKKLGVNHLPLVVAKIPAPHNEELAIGALCFNMVYFEKPIIGLLNIPMPVVNAQVKIARKKFNSYIGRFSIKKQVLKSQLKNRVVILVDDGIATGSSIKAALGFIKKLRPKKIFLAVPVAPSDFKIAGINQTLILHKDLCLSSVSQFYRHFPQVEDDEIKAIQ